MNTKKEIILGIKSRVNEINNLLKYYDAYLYLVVYDELNQRVMSGTQVMTEYHLLMI